MAAFYVHPVEFVLSGMIPALLPVVILDNRIHIVTIYTWLFLRFASAINTHSGYYFPWVPWDLMFMRGTSDYHDFHHSGGDFSGNYSG